jgi:hypothetical protein
MREISRDIGTPKQAIVSHCHTGRGHTPEERLGSGCILLKKHGGGLARRMLSVLRIDEVNL